MTDNAMNLIGYTRAVLKRAGNPPSVLTAFSNEAMSGVEIEHRLRPIGVCMAGPDIVDPFKD